MQNTPAQSSNVPTHGLVTQNFIDSIQNKPIQGSNVHVHQESHKRSAQEFDIRTTNVIRQRTQATLPSIPPPPMSLAPVAPQMVVQPPFPHNLTSLGAQNVAQPPLPHNLFPTSSRPQSVAVSSSAPVRPPAPACTLRRALS